MAMTRVILPNGQVVGQQSLTPDPARSWIDLSSETDENGQRRAYVNLVKDQTDVQLGAADNAAFSERKP